MPKGRKYPDLKYKFIRSLIAYEKHQRKFSYLKASAEWTSKAIVSLDLAEGEIRSIKQAQQLEGIGGTIADKLKNTINSDYLADPPPRGKYVSSGSALLVALYDSTQEAKSENPDDDHPLINHETLRIRCEEICEEQFLDISSSYGALNLCRTWWRINILESRGYVKKRSRSKEAVYQLLPLGEELAVRLKGEPVTFGDLLMPPVQKLAQDSLYTTDDGTDGIVMCVDHRELGGDRNKLITLSNILSRHHIKFKTLPLNVADYCWYLREHGHETALPYLVERKRADDLAESMKDGRFLRQRDKMKQWKNDFEPLSHLVKLMYIIEGNIERYVVSCGHECIGKCGNPDLIQVSGAISELENDHDIILLHTKHLQQTVDLLVEITSELRHKINSGCFQIMNNLRGVVDYNLSPGKPKPKDTSSDLKSTDNRKLTLSPYSPKPKDDDILDQAHLPTKKNSLINSSRISTYKNSAEKRRVSSSTSVDRDNQVLDQIRSIATIPDHHLIASGSKRLVWNGIYNKKTETTYSKKSAIDTQKYKESRISSILPKFRDDTPLLIPSSSKNLSNPIYSSDIFSSLKKNYSDDDDVIPIVTNKFQNNIDDFFHDCQDSVSPDSKSQSQVLTFKDRVKKIQNETKVHAYNSSNISDLSKSGKLLLRDDPIVISDDSLVSKLRTHTPEMKETRKRKVPRIDYDKFLISDDDIKCPNISESYCSVDSEFSQFLQHSAFSSNATMIKDDRSSSLENETDFDNTSVSYKTQDEKLLKLQSIFPDKTAVELQYDLSINNNDVHLTVEKLLM